MTAIELLVERLAENGILHSSDIAEANELFKQQIIDAYHEGQLSVLQIIEESLIPMGFDSTSDKEDKEDAIEYYNETFKSE